MSALRPLTLVGSTNRCNTGAKSLRQRTVFLPMTLDDKLISGLRGIYLLDQRRIIRICLGAIDPLRHRPALQKIVRRGL